MVTWIYFDNRNFGSATADGSPEITTPVENVFNADGTPLTEKYEGSQYITWDGQRMIVDTELPEQDSDLGSTVTAFVQYALTDCIAQQTDEYMLVFSSHGESFPNNFLRRCVNSLNAFRCACTLQVEVTQALVQMTMNPFVVWQLRENYWKTS